MRATQALDGLIYTSSHSYSAATTILIVYWKDLETLFGSNLKWDSAM